MKRIINTYLLLGYLLCLGTVPSLSQNFLFNVSINADKIAAITDERNIKGIESYVNTFVNKTLWGKEHHGNNKFPIKGNLLLTLETVSNGVFSGFLIIQAERPIFNTSYSSPLFNFKDNNVSFQFNLNQINIGFNENTFSSSNEPLQMNLPAILSFYAYMIMGYYYNSFGQYEGSTYFNKAFQIASNAGSNPTISNGWQAFASNNNRFILAQEMVSEQYKNVYTSSYTFFRKVLDNLYESKEKSIAGLRECLTDLIKLSTNTPNSIQLYLFMATHKDEMLNIIKYVDDKKQKKELLDMLYKVK